jgi:O-antigen ligase
MTAIADNAMAAVLVRRWRDPAAWTTTVDICAILLAASLPWSTSLVGIFATAMLLTRLPFLDLAALWRLARQPICAVPIALFALAALGMLWSDADWAARTYAVKPAAKLLVFPILFYHFQRSERGLWVLIAFLVSCVLLEAASWLVAIAPNLTMKPHGFETRGVVVKDYIDQSQEFAVCAVALVYPVIQLLRAKKFWQAALLAAIAFSFVANMAFVVVSRTALVTMPVMVAVFGLVHLRWRTNLMILAGVAVLGAVAFLASPQLESTVASFSSDYRQYKETGRATSIGERLEFWQKSLRFVGEAPLFGHGTGATRGLFERAAEGQTGAAATVIGNPHNQTLNVAVQWGALGVVILYAMWLVHLLLFRGEGLVNWIGLLVVVQNIFTSLFNSHVFDFHEGWMYVLGVGIAGGMALKAFATDDLAPVQSLGHGTGR